MILNLTGHAATPVQVAGGVVDAPQPILGYVVSALSSSLSSREEIDDAAYELVAATLAMGAETVMLKGGNGMVVARAEEMLLARGISVVYAL